ncbi:hypothetical protein CSB09_02105 [Candidatus Gracilibacteria bacterium]|nr:MAG: hypothetical protein CSB09_02105 [Candidatus Gracilibacteria bacterium]
MKIYKQIIIAFFLALSLSFISLNVSAKEAVGAGREDEPPAQGGGQVQGSQQGEGGEGGGLKQYLTEPVIGADCKCVYRDDEGNIHDENQLLCNQKVEKRLYKCTIPEGMAGFQSIFKSMVRWIAVIATLLGVLALVALGIAWAVTGGEDTEAKKFLKKWIQNIIIGLLILYTFGFILRFLAPWVYT